MSRTSADIVIAGGSFAGLALALALGRCLGAGLSVTVVDRAPKAAASDEDDPRAVALGAASVAMLEVLGVWPQLAPLAAPVARIEITDSPLEAGIRPVLLSWRNELAGEASDARAAAYIVPLTAIGRALATAVDALPGVTMIRGIAAERSSAGPFTRDVALGDGSTLAARLLVAADGAGSAIRNDAGIKTVRWPYAQSGIATTIAHEREHRGTAVQHFLPAGPFAILPLPGNRSCITWTEGEVEAARIMALDDDAFLAEVDRRFGGRLGALSLAGGRRSWPLALQLARAYVAPRLALVGDAAHAVHPLAGQGLNLALRDVAALTEVVADTARAGLDVGDAIALSRYEQWRRFDAMTAAAAFDALNRLFSVDARLLRSAREFGLQVVDRLPALKRAFVGEAAGTTGALPRLLRGELA